VVASPQAGEWAVIVQAIHRWYFRRFPRRTKPPLARARRHADEIVRLLYRYWRDRDFKPSEADIRALRILDDHLFRLHATARRLITRLERRFHGEPDISASKWLEWKDRR
jgi:hypothetical protein